MHASVVKIVQLFYCITCVLSKTLEEIVYAKLYPMQDCSKAIQTGPASFPSFVLHIENKCLQRHKVNVICLEIIY